MTSVLRKTSALSAHEKPTVGDSKISFVSIDHLGWLRCDGRLVSVEQYGILFNVIGHTFGGAGNFFNLPNASGVVPGISSPAYPTGTLAGEYFHTLTIAEMPSHNHGVAPGGQTAGNNLTSSNTHDHGGYTGLVATGITINNNSTGITINNNSTGITVDNATTGISIDSGGSHQHDIYWTPVDDKNFSGTVPAIPNSDTGGGQLGPYGGNIIASAGAHSHTITDTGHIHTITDPKHNHAITDPQHNHGITDPTHRHTISSYSHTHTLNPAGGDQPHNNMQPTLFIGNLFIYSGDPPAGTWPYTVGTNIY